MLSMASCGVIALMLLMFWCYQTKVFQRCLSTCLECKLYTISWRIRSKLLFECFTFERSGKTILTLENFYWKLLMWIKCKWSRYWSPENGNRLRRLSAECSFHGNLHRLLHLTEKSAFSKMLFEEVHGRLGSFRTFLFFEWKRSLGKILFHSLPFFSNFLRFWLEFRTWWA